MGAPRREHQPDSWYRQARVIKMHSAITQAVEERGLYLTDTSANNETSKRAHPFSSTAVLCHTEETGKFSSGSLLCVFALGKKFREF